jgi:putative Holliday junction resolvase
VSPKSGRILALDLGDVRIGLAISDPLGITAQPAGNLESRGVKKDLGRVRDLVREREVVEVVVGHPLLLSGRAGERALAAEEFARHLRQMLRDVPVELWDERWTTTEAERVMTAAGVRRARRRKVVDSLAAVVLLQSYIDARAERSGSPVG